MLIIWTDLNYKTELKFGNQLRGIQHRNKRPDKIIVSLQEIPECDVSISEIKEYIRRDLICSLSNEAKKEIILIH